MMFCKKVQGVSQKAHSYTYVNTEFCILVCVLRGCFAKRYGVFSEKGTLLHVYVSSEFRILVSFLRGVESREFVFHVVEPKLTDIIKGQRAGVLRCTARCRLWFSKIVQRSLCG